MQLAQLPKTCFLRGFREAPLDLHLLAPNEYQLEFRQNLGESRFDP